MQYSRSKHCIYLSGLKTGYPSDSGSPDSASVANFFVWILSDHALSDLNHELINLSSDRLDGGRPPPQFILDSNLLAECPRSTRGPVIHHLTQFFSPSFCLRCSCGSWSAILLTDSLDRNFICLHPESIYSLHILSREKHALPI